ncbi:hypothetical protein BP6252_08322 [Coleophoma cylindrospora]|uniref:N-acetyltransferase domain-containing protein n=1 Tax=Coleophoma cylindrospora TaxID=1849047 RepID=A0A3D8R5H0_9HELO|nr:hypothetical protein BP6252_08322 [Coleophoma cylindrospora]
MEDYTSLAPRFTITPALSVTDLAAVEGLLKVYCETSIPPLPQTELGNLPGVYAAPTGALLLARSTAPDTLPLGIIGLKCPAYLPGDVCEMSRLYVAPAARGTGLGKALVRASFVEAKRLGYVAMRLGAFESNGAALRLYEACGFRRRERYKPKVFEGLVFFEIDLRDGGPGAMGKEMVEQEVVAVAEG